jgi:accessory gene regulator protein AgrB
MLHLLTIVSSTIYGSREICTECAVVGSARLVMAILSYVRTTTEKKIVVKRRLKKNKQEANKINSFLLLLIALLVMKFKFA